MLKNSFFTHAKLIQTFILDPYAENEISCQPIQGRRQKGGQDFEAQYELTLFKKLIINGPNELQNIII